MKFDVPVAYSSEGDIERFVPGDALELPFAAFSHIGYLRRFSE